MEPKEQRILRIYFKTYLQYFIFYIAVLSIASVCVLISGRFITAVLLSLFFLIVLVLCFGMYFLFWLRVQNELKQLRVEENMITLQSVDIDHDYCFSLKGTPVVGEPKFILTDEQGDIYRMVADRDYLSYYYHGIVGERIAVRYLPETRFLLSVSLPEKGNISEKSKRDKKLVRKFFAPYLK